MSEDTPLPRRSRYSVAQHGTGKYERAEMATIKREAILERLDAMTEAIKDLRASGDRRFADLDKTTRHIESELAEFRGEVRSFRLLVDNVHSDYRRVVARVDTHDNRIDELEKAEARREGERRQGTLVASGAGVAGGGLLVAIAELVRRLVGQ